MRSTSKFLNAVLVLETTFLISESCLRELQDFLRGKPFCMLLIENNENLTY